MECACCEHKPPPLMPQNREAWRLWCLVQTQWRCGMDIVGLDYPAVMAVATLHNMVMTPRLFAKLQLLETETLAKRAAEHE